MPMPFGLADLLLRRLPRVRALEAAVRDLAGERERLLAQRDALERERDELAAHTTRLSDEIAASHERERQAGEKIAKLLAQRDALESERDGLRVHAERLARELQDAGGQRDALAAERDELRSHCERLAEAERRRRRLVWAEPGHFYSPIVNPGEASVRAAATQPRDFAVDEACMRELFHAVARRYPEIPFPRLKSPGFRYYFENPAFSFGDAITLFGLMLEFRPRRVIEVGSGFSSCALMDINDRFFEPPAELLFLDPFPQTLESLLPAHDPYRARIRAIPLQEAPLEWFQALGGGDFLFIDSSHVAKTGSDVLDYLFRIFPALQPGVIVHIHDVFYPFEYPREWIEENRSWNEAYFIRAFLEGNDAFEILYWNDFLYRVNPGRTAEMMPVCLENTGGSLWLRKAR